MENMVSLRDLKTVKVVVGAKEISEGAPDEPHCCPVSLAIRKTMLPEFKPFVYSAMVRIFKKKVQKLRSGKEIIAMDEYDRVPLPESAALFVHSFDDGNSDMMAFTFEMQLPPKCLKPTS